MFGIVGTLLVVDIIFLVLTTVESNSKLRREYEEIEAKNVSTDIFSYKPIYIINQCII